MTENMTEFKTKLEKILINVAKGFDDYIPETGKTRGAVLYFETPCEWAKVCFFDVSRTSDKTLPDVRVLSFGAKFPDDSGRKMSNYVFKGSKADMLEYIKSSECLSETLKAIEEFDEKIRIHD